MYLLGCDIGSSSVKAALINAETFQTLAVSKYPDVEMAIDSPQPGYAEQDPEQWWSNLQQAIQRILKETEIDASLIKGIGIAYQMHGLVVVDHNLKVLRPSIIWCDSRAVEIGNQAFEQIGQERCLRRLLNSPGNFTASKLKWVKENEPATYSQIFKFMLPGDYIAMKMTGRVTTTISGLSEGVVWDFEKNEIADLVMNEYGISEDMIPEVHGSFEPAGELTKEAANFLGLVPGIRVSYRAGDQPNNALSLNVLEPGEIAGTGGTSGVIYGVVDQIQPDSRSRVNCFAHVNHTKNKNRIGVLLCINGAGIQYGWTRKVSGDSNRSYSAIEADASHIPIGAEGIRTYPFGNGAERIFENRIVGSHIRNLDFNRHANAHLYRASLEGIAFSFVYGINIMREMGLEPRLIRVGNDNLFQSDIFSQTISSLANTQIEILESTGAVGAARAAGVGVGFYSSAREAMSELKRLRVFEPLDVGGNTREYMQTGRPI